MKFSCEENIGCHVTPGCFGKRASGIKKKKKKEKCKFHIMEIAYLIKKLTLSCVQGNESTAEAITCLP